MKDKRASLKLFWTLPKCINDILFHRWYTVETSPFKIGIAKLRALAIIYKARGFGNALFVFKNQHLGTNNN
jgi:hypothetical protein